MEYKEMAKVMTDEDSGYRTKYDTELYPGEISTDWRS